MADNHFDLVIVWDNLGGAVRVNAGGKATVVDPSTGALVSVVQDGQSVTTVTADGNGRVSFVAQQSSVKLLAGGLSMVAYSAEALDVVGSKLDDASAAASVGNTVTAFGKALENRYAASVETPIVPPGALRAIATMSAGAAWFAAQRAIVERFTVSHPVTVGQVIIPCDTSSGNIDVGIYAVTRTGTGVFDTPLIVSTGPIPCPAVSGGRIVVTLPATLLRPGQYAIGLWADNTTFAPHHLINNAIQYAGLTIADIAASSTGLLTRTGAGYAGRAFTCLIEPVLPVRAVASLIGDSITANQTWFSTANTKAGVPYTIVNHGVGGAQTSSILNQVAPALADNPAVVSVLGGTNDLPNGVSAATVKANLDSMYTQILGAGADVLACEITPRWDDTAGVPLPQAILDAIADVNAWIRGQGTRPGVTVVAWHDVMTTGDGVTPVSSYLIDNVHPNAAGSAVMANVLAPLLPTSR